LKARGYPFSVILEGRGINLTWATPDKNTTIEIRGDRYTIETPMFDMRKAVVTLDKEIFVDIKIKGALLRSFKLILEGGELSSFWRPDNIADHGLNFNSFTLIDLSSPVKNDAVLRMNSGYVVNESAGVMHPTRWRIS